MGFMWVYGVYVGFILDLYWTYKVWGLGCKYKDLWLAGLIGITQSFSRRSVSTSNGGLEVKTKRNVACIGFCSLCEPSAPAMVVWNSRPSETLHASASARRASTHVFSFFLDHLWI